jgi:hypothetical protein
LSEPRISAAQAVAEDDVGFAREKNPEEFEDEFRRFLEVGRQDCEVFAFALRKTGGDGGKRPEVPAEFDEPGREGIVREAFAKDRRPPSPAARVGASR